MKHTRPSTENSIVAKPARPIWGPLINAVVLAIWLRLKE